PAPSGHGPVPQVDPRALDLLREDLADYTVDTLADVLGPLSQAALTRDHTLPAARWATGLLASDGRSTVETALAAGEARAAVQEALRADGSREHDETALAALVACFMLARPVRRRALDRALPRLGVSGAQRLGLVTAAGAAPDDEVRPAVDLQPYAATDARGTAHWWVASDLAAQAGGGPLPTDHVLGVGGASLMLAGVTMRRPVGRVLDLGTGCGVQALHAARHARHVTGTDLSARALAFAGFTWALNGPLVDGVGLDLRRGSLLEPVAGQRFDLVVSNPPFVITPRGPGVPRYDYRDGGEVGDALVRNLVTGVGEVLAPGGVAQLLGNWEHRRGEPWQERVGAWLDASGLDGWVVQREVQDPAEYAETWIRDGGQAEGSRFDELYAAWLDDFEARGVDAVGFGVITLRRPGLSAAGDAQEPGRVTLRRVEEVRHPVSGPLGGHLEACLAAHDWLESAGAGEAGLAAARLRVAQDVTEERHHRPGEADPQVILLRQGGGFGRSVQASTALAGLVGACDGELTVGRLIGALAGLLEVPACDLAAELLPAVRRLVADGFLLPVED
ncbi:MAG TPA: methyltransferase, partial [Kineosporiaceae bacterium]|nr:methyltransferase [Kineosporiaceae bacterium]